MSATTRAYTHRIQPFRFPLVPVAGLEPARPYGRRILSALCLPISSDWHRKRSTAFYGALVPPVGLEPTRSHERHILSVVCLPIPPQRQKKRERKQTRETTTRPQCAQPAGHTHTSRTIGQPNPRARTLSTGPPRPAQLTHQHREHPGANTQAPPAHTQRTIQCRHTPQRDSTSSREHPRVVSAPRSA